MKRILSAVLAVAVVFSVSFSSFTAPALAASPAIESAKAQCVIGERKDGYLGVVSGKSASTVVLREMRSVNQQRRAAYERLAERNGVTIDVAAALTAERLINAAKSGECVQNAAGEWVKIS